MFVAGEVQDPLIDTVRQVEDIVRGQVIELVRSPSSLSFLQSIKTKMNLLTLNLGRNRLSELDRSPLDEDPETWRLRT